MQAAQGPSWGMLETCGEMGDTLLQEKQGKEKGSETWSPWAVQTFPQAT